MGMAVFRATDGKPLPWWGFCAFAAFFLTGAIQWMFYLHRKPE